MKKLIMGMTIFSVFLLIGCQNASNPDAQENSSAQTESDSILETESNINSNVGTESETEFETESETTTEVDTSVEDETETGANHTHTYVETIKNATCETDGTITYTCDCGDYYTETIKSTGHVWGEYVFDDNATYTADATKTATCEICQKKDTKVVSGTKLDYTYENLDIIMFATADTHIRNSPSSDGKKLGKVYEGQQLIVTGQCKQTKWYRIEYNGQVAYINNKYCKTELEYRGYWERYSTDATPLYEQPNTNSKIIEERAAFKSLLLYPSEYDGWYMQKTKSTPDGGKTWIEHISYIQKENFLTWKEAKAILNEGIDEDVYGCLSCVSDPIEKAYVLINVYSAYEFDSCCVHIQRQHHIVPTEVGDACSHERYVAEQRWYNEVNPIYAYYNDDGTIEISEHTIFTITMTEEEYNDSLYKDTINLFDSYDDYSKAFDQYVVDAVYAVLNSYTK